MKDFSEILLTHAEKYSIFEPTDAVKLIYQSEFGVGHLVSNTERFCEMLDNEYRSCKKLDSQPMIEDIGSGMCRVYLSSSELDEYGARALSKLAVASLGRPSGNSFDEKLEVLKKLCGKLPFELDELEKYLSEYGEPHPVSHSSAYREAYSPAYRVLPYSYVMYIPLFAELERNIDNDKHISLAIDGMCGSGKSTLAALICRIYGVEAVHMDDFFLPPSLRTDDRLSEAGGNVHYERFENECAHGVKSGESFSYRRFDCSRMDYNGTVSIPMSKINVVEGTYCQHPRFGDIYTMRVFLYVPDEVQSRRIMERNGAKMHKAFVERWIPMENRYFSAYNIADKCDFKLNTSN